MASVVIPAERTPLDFRHIRTLSRQHEQHFPSSFLELDTYHLAKCTTQPRDKHNPAHLLPHNGRFSRNDEPGPLGVSRTQSSAFSYITTTANARLL